MYLYKYSRLDSIFDYIYINVNVFEIEIIKRIG